ncbi:MAG TPA: DUF4157 domain-containing protein [Anaeromyxobacter sp.]|nr:DUF4157 domain-containing protein [Anaeromyxobacter sp.]
MTVAPTSLREAAWRSAGRAGGLVAYYAGKVAMRALNAGKSRRPPSEESARRLGWLFPSLDLSRVAIVEGATLVARWVERPPRTAGMAFGHVVYLAHPYSERTHEGLLVLAHELGHVQQIEALGEAAFARRYGEEWLAHGYAQMPLERAAEGCRAALRERLARGAGDAS